MNALGITPSLRDILEERRDYINQKVRNFLLHQKTLDPGDFVKHISDYCSPLSAQIEATQPERFRLSMLELIDISLDLFRLSKLVPQTGSAPMRRLWGELFPRIADPIARSPKMVLGQFCNALIFLEQRGVLIANRWIDGMMSHADRVETPAQLLSLGKITAWMSGLAAYRHSAIAEAKALPVHLSAPLFGLTEDQVLRFLESLHSNPWALREKDDIPYSSGPSIRMKCCAFQGFGGELIFPPQVGKVEQQLVVSDGERVWNLFADRFGWMTQLSNFRPTEMAADKSKKVFVQPNGIVRWNNENRRIEELIGSTSQAFDGQTLAVTTQTSFHVYLISHAE